MLAARNQWLRASHCLKTKKHAPHFPPPSPAVKLPAMTSDDLTPEQIAALTDKLMPYLGWVRALCERCDKQLPASDPLWIAAHQAHDGALALRVALHYAAVKDGVGRKSRAGG